jgi:hypothetical protein
MGSTAGGGDGVRVGEAMEQLVFARFLGLLLVVALPWAVGECGVGDLCGRGQLILRSEE